MGPSRGMRQRTSTKGHIPPLFLGGSLPSFSLSRVVSVSEPIIVHKHNRMKQIEESGFAALLDLATGHPPPESVPTIIDHCTIENSQISGCVSRADLAPQTARLAMLNSRQSRLLR